MGDERTGQTAGIGSYLEGERSRLLGDRDEGELEKMRAAERQHLVFEAWNAVCAGTREGAHVTGLCYLPDANQLVVYTDGTPWTQELMMMREIIRARMSIKGVDVASILVKTSRDGYRARPVDSARGRGLQPGARTSVPLDPEERALVEESVAGIGDEKLRKAVGRAMTASLEWNKATEGGKTS